MAERSRLTILAIDDDESTRLYLKQLLKRDYDIHLAATPQEALRAVQKHPIDIALLDILLDQGESGLTLLKELKKINEEMDVIVVSGVNMPKTIVTAMQTGASDYVVKPIEREALIIALSRVINQRNLRSKNNQLQDELEAKNEFRIIGRSPAFLQIKEMATRLKGHNANVFLVGDTGTGKEMFARLIHRQEEQPSRPFVSINCAAIPENLLESMLFGHEKGSFTGATERRLGKFELANGGDIFLDEISCLNLDLQAKLLRVLETQEVERVGGNVPKKVSFRVIAASNDNIIQMAATGEFRKDLFYRLNTVTIQLPSLNERKEDVIPLAEHFLVTCRRTRTPKKLAPAVKEILTQHNWRGNVRELKNTVENMIIFSKDDVIQPRDIPFLKNDPIVPQPTIDLKEHSNGNQNGNGGMQEVALAADDEDSVSLDGEYNEVLRRVEKELILRSLIKNRWNKTRTSESLGIKRNKLYRKLSELGIDC